MKLTEIQKVILEELINGCTNQQIAEKISYSQRSTIRKIKNLCKLFNVNNRYELIKEGVIVKSAGEL